MKLTAVPGITAGVAVVVAGLIGTAPVAAPVRARQVGNIALTAGAQDALDGQLNFNSSLIEGFVQSNGDLIDFQHKLVPGLSILLGARVDPDDHYAIHGLAKDAVEQYFDAHNASIGATEAGLFGVLGARGTMNDGTFTPLNLEDLNTSLLVDARHEELIPFAGLESALGHYIGSAVFLSAGLSGIPESEVETNPAADSFVKVVADVNTFNQAILSAEKNFDTNLVANEVNLQQAMFGTDSAYHGVINRAFNAFNMLYDAKEQGFNGLLGLTGYDPQEHTAALLTGGGDAAGQIFNDGSVGGLLGMVDQQLAALIDSGGAAGSSGIPVGFTADPAEVSTALSTLMGTLRDGPFGDVFASGGAFALLLADLQAMFAAFGS